MLDKGLTAKGKTLIDECLNNPRKWLICQGIFFRRNPVADIEKNRRKAGNV